MKGESFKTWGFRQLMNLYPMFFGTGGKLVYLQRDFKHAVVEIKLGLWTRNYVGTIFGGSQFSAMDPFHMVLLMNCIGSKDYVVWDKAATITFKKPGKTTIKTEIVYSDEELENIRQQAQTHGKFQFIKSVDWRDRAGDVVSTIEKTIYVATKEYSRAKKTERDRTS